MVNATTMLLVCIAVAIAATLIVLAATGNL
jgi:hypothetical protein